MERRKRILGGYRLHNQGSYVYNWTLAVVRAKEDWTPAIGINCLRPDVDYSDMGPGNFPIFNTTKFHVLKRWEFRTDVSEVGSALGDHYKKRKHSFSLRQMINAAPNTTVPGEQVWKTMNEAI